MLASDKLSRLSKYLFPDVGTAVYHINRPRRLCQLFGSVVTEPHTSTMEHTLHQLAELQHLVISRCGIYTHFFELWGLQPKVMELDGLCTLKPGYKNPIIIEVRVCYLRHSSYGTTKTSQSLQHFWLWSQRPHSKWCRTPVWWRLAPWSAYHSSLSRIWCCATTIRSSCWLSATSPPEQLHSSPPTQWVSRQFAVSTAPRTLGLL